MRVQDITVVPQQPAQVKGVINLRGKIIPVVDLRLKLVCRRSSTPKRTCILVQLRGSANAVLTGIVVDSVAEVLTLRRGRYRGYAPTLARVVATPHLLGMANVKGKVKILLDSDEVMNSQELYGLDALTR